MIVSYFFSIFSELLYSRKIFLILSGDGIKKGHIPSDCYIKVTHMDIFPSLFEYMRLPVKKEWDLDGRSRIEW